MSADTRERILQVASELFAEQGYDGTSLRTIADRMGFTKAALYYHFNSKDEILRALVEPAMTLQTEFVERLDASDSAESWADTLTWLVGELLDNMDLFKLLERNQAAVEAMLTDATGAFFEEHRALHERIEAATRKPGLTLGEQVRMVCALGAATGFDDFGSHLLLSADPDALQREMNAVFRQILGLPKARRPLAGARPGS